MELNKVAQELDSWCDQPWMLQASEMYLEFDRKFTFNELTDLYLQHQVKVDNIILNMIKVGKEKAGLIFSKVDDLIKCLIYHRFRIIKSLCENFSEYTSSIVEDELNSALISLFAISNLDG